MSRTIGVLTSGGDAPGMNAAIRAVVRSALSRGFDVYGIYDGYYGLSKGDFALFNRSSVSDIMYHGGTILGTARLPEFVDAKVQYQAIEQMKKAGIDSLVCLGGDGTYRGASALCDKGISCIGVPATIDNDCPGTDYTIGFYTALNTIVEAVDKLRDTSASHHRCSVVEVMGNHCGDLALYAGLCCGAEVVITPEEGYDEEEVIRKLQYFDATKKKRHSIVIVSEKLMDVNKLAAKITEKTSFAGRATILGHLQRGGVPVPSDRLLATRLGDYAVELLAQGKSNLCVGVKNNELVATDIMTAVNEPKNHKINQELIEIFNRMN